MILGGFTQKNAIPLIRHLSDTYTLSGRVFLQAEPHFILYAKCEKPMHQIEEASEEMKKGSRFLSLDFDAPY